eukprot:CAMPEP_0175782168 /NCGR_PEP_ID=MMETSP0097-20121207/77640_1 /TAXON_ID=311494 /ORGANISM="Alexandrium monilatum, Strain CCMP3105" /LENGTH=352 /DNA_ID=CAMNT_0017092973 /DNA_START=56 /DNA_END=1111 /DNA_ORIENTATION=-
MEHTSTPASAASHGCVAPPLQRQAAELDPASSEESSLWRPKTESPHRSDGSAPAPAPIIATGEINEFHMYQRFRLKMVQMFGSLASALYEFGADPETGSIPRERFEEVVSGQLGVLAPAEASLLFSHVTDANPLDQGLGGRAVPRNFGITDEEWRQLVLRKRSEKDGDRGASIPFSSGPSGGSMGAYHRAIRIGSRSDQSLGRHDAPETPGTRASASASSATMPSPREASLSSRARAPSGSAGGTRPSRRCGGSVKPWSQPQKPWSRSMLAGEGMPHQAQVFRGTLRILEQGPPFSTAGKASLLTAQPAHRQLGESERRVRTAGHVLPARLLPRPAPRDGAPPLRAAGPGVV